jgi:hypothetical protein
LCSDYIEDVTWSSWTADSAVGVGTLMSNNGIPDCGDGTWSAQSDYTVTLSDPQMVSYCTDTGEASGLLYTSTNLWGNATLPDITPPCPDIG